MEYKIQPWQACLNQTAEISSTSDKKLICSTPQTNKKRLRSSTSIFNKEDCIICLSNEGATIKFIKNCQLSSLLITATIKFIKTTKRFEEALF